MEGIKFLLYYFLYKKSFCTSETIKQQPTAVFQMNLSDFIKEFEVFCDED